VIRPLGRPGKRWKDDISMDLRVIEWEDMDRMHLAQDNTLVNMVMNLGVP
jgi:hypothetical protein